MEQILCIDNSITIRKIVGDCVSDLGYAFLEAENGKEGLDIARTIDNLSLIILDWNMPVMSGRETLSQFRSIAQFKQTKILVLIKVENKEQVMDALDLGANMYILKPFSVNNLQDTIQQVMESAE